MFMSGTAKAIGKGAVRLAAVLAGLQLPVAVAEVAGRSARMEHAGNVDCVGHSMNAVISLGHTALSMLDACVVGQLAHAAGGVLSGSLAYPVQAVVGIFGHEMVGHLVSFLLQTLS
jgi:hypothetical protein